MTKMSIILAAGLAAAPATAAPTWVPAWAASQQPVWGPDFAFPTNIPADLADTTVRQVVHLGYGGSRVRIVLSNVYGAKPVHIAGARLAMALRGAATVAGTDRLVHFGGRGDAFIPAGATVLSDPVAIETGQGRDVAISLRFAQAPDVASFHWDGRRTSYVMRGDQMAATQPSVAETTTVRLFVSGVLVEANSRGTVVVLGDSITDGAGASLDGDRRWPDFLAARAAPKGIAVVNAGISGARLLGDRMGANALARLDRDVFAQPRVRTLLLMLGINDIAWPGTPFAPGDPQMDFATLTAGYTALVDRAHAHDVRVVAGTLTPFEGALPGTPLEATYYDPAKDALRRRVNEWIRGSGVFDEVIDFDRLLADPSHPKRLLERFDSGDRLHPGDAGDRAMADAVNLDTLLGDVE